MTVKQKKQRRLRTSDFFEVMPLMTSDYNPPPTVPTASGKTHARDQAFHLWTLEHHTSAQMTKGCTAPREGERTQVSVKGWVRKKATAWGSSKQLGGGRGSGGDGTENPSPLNDSSPEQEYSILLPVFSHEPACSVVSFSSIVCQALERSHFSFGYSEIVFQRHHVIGRANSSYSGHND